MKKVIVIISAIFIICSIGLNIYFLCGKGINIDKRITNHQEQYQMQWQGQLLINQWTAQGNEIEWKRIQNIRNLDNFIEIELNKLHPISALYAKVVLHYHNNSAADTVDIVYPDIFVKTKEKEIK